MKLDQLSIHYLIPGHQAELSGPEGTEELHNEDDYAPYSQTPRLDTSSLGRWTELLGLTEVTRESTQIDPPRTSYFPDGSTRVEAEKMYRQVSVERQSSGVDGTHTKYRRL
jgi:hypothetical protein